MEKTGSFTFPLSGLRIVREVDGTLQPTLAGLLTFGTYPQQFLPQLVITFSDYQRLNQVDALTAGRELRGLVQAGLIEQQSAHRWTYYTLTVPRELSDQQPEVSQEEQILAYARENGSIGSAECQALLQVDYRRAWYLLKKLAENGQLSPTGNGKGRRYHPAKD